MLRQPRCAYRQSVAAASALASTTKTIADRAVQVLRVVLLLVPILSAGLYLMGAAYQDGYLARYGIEESMFPQPTDRVFLMGTLSLMDLGVDAAVNLLMPAMLLVLATMGLGVLASFEWFCRIPRCLVAKIEEWLRRFRMTRKIPLSMDRWVDRSLFLFVCAIGVFLITATLVTIAVVALRSGREQAELEIARFAKGEGSFVVVSTEPPAPEKKALLIRCGATYCAFWTGNGKTLLVREDKILKMEAHPVAASASTASSPLVAE